MNDFINVIIDILPSVIAACATVILAIIAVYNYRSRPILIRSYERHTEDLRNILKEWIEQLPDVRKTKDTDDILGINTHPKIELPRQTPIKVESKSLFDDLKKHEPKNVSSLDRWAEYKDRLDKYNEKRYNLLLSIYNDILQRSGLNHDPTFRYGINPRSVKAVYLVLFNEVKKLSLSNWIHMIEESKVEHHQNNEFTLFTSEGTLALGTEKEMKLVKEVLIKITTEISNLPKYSDWRKRIQELDLEKIALDGDRRNLLREVNNFGLIPLMTEKCQYINV